MKSMFKIEKPRKLIYRNCSNNFYKYFKSDVLVNIRNGKKSYLEFEKNYAEAPDKHAPKKTKKCKWYHKPHINKTLRKAIIKRLDLKMRQIKRKGRKYGKQRKYKAKLNDQSKQEHFDSLSPFQDSKPF